MKYEQRKKSAPYSTTIKQRFPKMEPKMIRHLLNIQDGKVRA